MKNWIKIVLFLPLVFWSCDSEDANDCIQTAGSLSKEEREVEHFNRILVEDGVNMVFKQTATQRVEVETGKNLQNDIRVQVVDGQLQLKNENSCNYLRDYNLTTVYVYSPDIVEIRSATQGEIHSDGPIKVDKLMVYSENYRNEEYLTSGELFLEVDVEEFQLVFNGISNMYIKGKAQRMNLNLASGNSRIEARNFEVESASIYHRSSNDVIVNVNQLLQADLYGTGDLIAVKTPDSIQVNEHYKGRLIVE